MLTKERKRTDNFTPSLSPEGWAALKNSNIAGTSDKDLAEVYEVTETAIRKRRSNDKAWAIAVGLRNRVLNRQGVKSKHLENAMPITKRDKDIENRAIEAVVSTFSDESQTARLLALQIGTKGLRAAMDVGGGLKAHLEPQEPAHVKVYADIAAMAGSWQPETSITVNCQAFAGASLARNNENENTIMDV